MSNDEVADPTRRTVVGLAGGAVAVAATDRASGAIRTPYPVSASDLTAMDAVTLAGVIRTGRASSVEVMAAFLDRIDQVNPAVNAIVALQPREVLLAQAREADAKRARGEPLGPLHGLPHAVKDLQSVKGIVYQMERRTIWPALWRSRQDTDEITQAILFATIQNGTPDDGADRSNVVLGHRTCGRVVRRDHG